MRINLSKGLLGGTVASSILFATGAAVAANMVALLLPENVNPRWEQQDAAAFVRTMGQLAPDVKVEVFNANNDTATSSARPNRL